MAILTLTQAKAHLRVTTSADDTDITLKLAQAEGIILNYLLARANKVATIVSSSVANPTVITTAAAHGFVNTETVTIAGHTGSVPAIAGAYVVSNATELTFTIPVAVTTAGIGGTATVPWDATSAPVNVQAAILLMLTHLFEHRGDDPQTDSMLWMAIARLLARHRDPTLV